MSIISNFFWRFLERCSAQMVSLFVSIILARLLSPHDYGVIALITVFTAVLQVFVDSGLGNALIQKKDADDGDFSTVFYTNVFFCTVLYCLMFFLAPAIAGFYRNASMTPMIRVLGLTVLISGVKNVQQAYVSRNMLFKRFFFSTLGGTAVSAVIGVMMAYRGFGAWALVWQQVINTGVDTFILWLTVEWKPKKIFSVQKLKVLYSFGWKLLVSALLDTVYNNLRSLIIGRMYSASDLGFYNRGKQFPNLIVNNINTSIDSVLLPAMSKEQEDRERVKAMTRRSIRTSVYIMAPLMVGLMVVAEPLVRLVLTEKWLPCIPFLRIFCITYIFYPIHTANLNAIKAMGRSDLFLRLEIWKKITGMAVLFSTIWFGVMAMAYSLLASSVLGQIINSWPNKKLLNYSYLEQLKDILPVILLAAVMGLCILPLQMLPAAPVFVLLVQVLLGAVIYITGSIIFRMESFLYLWDIVKMYVWKK